MRTKSAKKHLEKITKFEGKIIDKKESSTILFADLVGSTWYKYTMPFVDGLKRTYIHNSIVTEIINQHSGKIIKYIGDEVMAQFANPDDAVRSAIELQETFSKLDVKPKIQCKIGIHYGEIAYFNYEGSDQLDPQGTTVDLAARLVSNSKPNQILLTDSVVDACSENFSLSEFISIRPKGINQENKLPRGRTPRY